MPYQVKEIFFTLQGEGFHAGRPAVFCRFSACNLWSGREKDRDGALCSFCDTDFRGMDGPGGGFFLSAFELAKKISSYWPDDRTHFFVVLTGGEPLLQLTAELIDALHAEQAYVAVETNGSLPLPCVVDWICVSPKWQAPLLLTHGHELKVVVPQENQDLSFYETMDFKHFFLQPMDGPRQKENTRWAISYCMTHPRWHLSVQLHKYLNIP